MEVQIAEKKFKYLSGYEKPFSTLDRYIYTLPAPFATGAKCFPRQ
jgi:hypothetical protein